MLKIALPIIKFRYKVALWNPRSIFNQTMKLQCSISASWKRFKHLLMEQLIPGNYGIFSIIIMFDIYYGNRKIKGLSFINNP